MTTPEPEAKRYRETTEIHPRLVKCPLLIEESRAFWERAIAGGPPPSRQEAFDQYWFGAKSMSWIKELIHNLQSRFGAFPEALQVLHRWPSMTPETRSAICHWHVQITDPVYRAFSGDFLVARRDAANPDIHRSTVVSWIEKNGNPNWTLPTRKKLATRLLSVAYCAGLIAERRDPRTPMFPRIADEALAYILYLLRIITFSGTLLDNPYLRSVGLSGPSLDSRLRKLASLKFQRAAGVVELNWQYPDLAAWAEAELPSCGGAS